MEAADAFHGCPCYAICSSLGIEQGQWCRYRQSDVPPPGQHHFVSEEEQRPGGVQADIQMLACLLTEGCPTAAALLRAALARVQDWARAFREEHAGYQPVR